MNKLIQSGAAACFVGGLFAACSAGGGGNAFTTGTNGAGGSTITGMGGSQANSSSGAGNNDTTGGLGGNLTVGVGPASGSGGAGTGGAATCAGETSTAQLIPLDIYLMLDSSGSMTDVTGAGPTKWTAVTQALTTFFADPASTGLGVGIQHFPLTAAGVPDTCTTNSQCPGATGPCLTKTCDGLGAIVPCTKNSDCAQYFTTCVALGECGNEYCEPAGSGTCTDNGLACNAITTSFCVNADSCATADYATPAVEIAALNGAAGPLDTAMNAWMPNGSTPSAPALSGAIAHAKTWATANPTHSVVVLLATDGLPTECTPTDIPSIAALAAAGASGTPSIKTFAIGVFAQADIASGAQTNLNQIAAAGGSGQAFIIDTSQNVETQFIAALNAIRGTKLACEYQVPAVGDAGALDYGKVNIEYTPAGASVASTIGYVSNAASCDPTAGGWYYDVDPASGGTPTKIIMCGATCTTFGAQNGGEVGISVGCKTVIQPPPN